MKKEKNSNQTDRWGCISYKFRRWACARQMGIREWEAHKVNVQHAGCSLFYKYPRMDSATHNENGASTLKICCISCAVPYECLLHIFTSFFFSFFTFVVSFHNYWIMYVFKMSRKSFAHWFQDCCNWEKGFHLRFRTDLCKKLYFQCLFTAYKVNFKGHYEDVK